MFHSLLSPPEPPPLLRRLSSFSFHLLVKYLLPQPVSLLADSIAHRTHKRSTWTHTRTHQLVSHSLSDHTHTHLTHAHTSTSYTAALDASACHTLMLSHTTPLCGVGVSSHLSVGALYHRCWCLPILKVCLMTRSTLRFPRTHTRARVYVPHVSSTRPRLHAGCILFSHSQSRQLVSAANHRQPRLLLSSCRGHLPIVYQISNLSSLLSFVRQMRKNVCMGSVWNPAQALSEAEVDVCANGNAANVCARFAQRERSPGVFIPFMSRRSSCHFVSPLVSHLLIQPGLISQLCR